MATATATFAINAYPKGEENTVNLLRAHGVITVSSGGTYATGGLGCPITDKNLTVPSTPFEVRLTVNNSSPTGFVYTYDLANAKLRIFATGTASGDALNELSSGATVSADTIVCEALFTKSGQ